MSSPLPQDFENLDPRSHIIIKGARVHNLKGVDVAIPRNQLVVITGLSGSGKSSLAFDTLFAEGQRMYVESLNSYARQFLGRMEKPAVDYIRGVSPAIAIEQKVNTKKPIGGKGITDIIFLKTNISNIIAPEMKTEPNPKINEQSAFFHNPTYGKVVSGLASLSYFDYGQTIQAHEQPNEDYQR
jgi:excinuclease UvrABC ATPase subunit